MEDLSIDIKSDLLEKFLDIKMDLSSLAGRLQRIEDRQENVDQQLQDLKVAQIKLTEKYNIMEDKLRDLEDRSRSLNLRFRNVPEDITDEKLLDYLKELFDCLGLSSEQYDNNLSWLHHLFQKKQDQKFPRDVIAAFVSLDFKRKVYQRARNTDIKQEKFKAIKVLTDVSFLTRQQRNVFSPVFPSLKKYNIKFKWNQQSALQIYHKDIWKTFSTLEQAWLKDNNL
ncbi:Hypothetical predicted protein [Pelobates cultripes]|uniref:L1 transposable element RRM domain-containing protein n=1 Tax=Pelobates cultripes TaxID=61616 RepID=A0AAD1RYA3_PELCU|nr:Hypothetical predicted protein [Pelobates cultripes]